MSVDTAHPEYDAHRFQWERLRDVVAGRDAILTKTLASYYRQTSTGRDMEYLAATAYLPKLSGQSRDEYAAYAYRSVWFGATDRTINALAGLIFAKPATESLPTAIEPYSQDITLDGCSLRELAQQLVFEELTTTRTGLMVDYPAVETAGLSAAQAERLNIRPYVKVYKAESIIDWEMGNVGGAQRLVMVRLHEVIDQPGAKEFERVQVEQYRVLDLANGAYRVRIFRKDSMGNWVAVEERFPQMRGATMDFIPFVFVAEAHVRKPLLIDLADLNLAHFRSSADLENGLHYTGLPQPVVTGAQLEPGQSLRIGGSSAWVLPDPSADAKYLEFTGQGLNTLRDSMKDKEARMAVLGARMLAEEKRAPETEGTVELRTAGERSMLASVANDCSEAIRKALNIMARWVGAPETAEFSLSTDYGVHRMAPNMLQQLVGAWQAGAMPLQTLFDNLQQGEIVAPDATFEDYQAQLEQDAPGVTTTAPADQAGSSILSGLRSRLGL